MVGLSLRPFRMIGFWRAPLRAAAAVVVATALLWGGLASSVGAQSLDAVEIATKRGVVLIEVEVARTPEQRTTGLMYRKSLPDRQGMLFDFEADQYVSMWMKNTFIPLDMLFIRADGSIARIAENTTPHSENTISSGEPVRAVIEIGGGEARKLGIAAGDKVANTLFRGR